MSALTVADVSRWAELLMNSAMQASMSTETQRDAWLFQNRKALDSVRRGLKEAGEGKAKPAGSFAAFAEDEE
jgi:hypothetical protein